MKALIIGATGAVGTDLLNMLLRDNDFEEIEIFVRKSSGIEDEKLNEHIVDFEHISEWKHLVCGDVLFSCLGTTKKAAGSKEAQWHIDYDYQYEVAKYAAENNVKNYVLLSSIGADAKSSIFYLRMKGALDEAVKALPFNHTVVIRPASLIRKNTDRLGEKISVPIIQFLNRFGILQTNAPVLTEAVADVMIKSVKTDKTGYEINNLSHCRA